LGLNLKLNKPLYILVEIKEKDKVKIMTLLQLNNYTLVENITNYNKIDNPYYDGTHNDYLFKAL
jgi:hypothetical protein